MGCSQIFFFFLLFSVSSPFSHKSLGGAAFTAKKTTAPFAQKHKIAYVKIPPHRYTTVSLLNKFHSAFWNINFNVLITGLVNLLVNTFRNPLPLSMWPAKHMFEILVCIQNDLLIWVNYNFTIMTRNKYEIIIKMTSSYAYFARGLVWKLEEVWELQAQTLINALKCLSVTCLHLRCWMGVANTFNSLSASRSGSAESVKNVRDKSS